MITASALVYCLLADLLGITPALQYEMHNWEV
jgi:hypothetical protein